MKHSTRIRGGDVRVQSRPATASPRSMTRLRLSSRKPRMVIGLAFAAAALAFLLTGYHFIISGTVGWWMLALGALHAAVVVVGCAMWKNVERGDGHFVVSDLFRSETVAFEDVCLIVEAKGFVWKRSRLHFNRPTKFGWGISFVPTQSAEMYRTPLTNWRSRRIQREKDGPSRCCSS